MINLSSRISFVPAYVNKSQKNKSILAISPKRIDQEWFKCDVSFGTSYTSLKFMLPRPKIKITEIFHGPRRKRHGEN